MNAPFVPLEGNIGGVGENAELAHGIARALEGGVDPLVAPDPLLIVVVGVLGALIAGLWHGERHASNAGQEEGH